MGGALPMHIRSLIIEQLKKEGSSMIAVCTAHGLSYATVRKLWKRYKAEGMDGLKPHYDRCGPSEPKSGALIYRCALWLKRHHPDWGAALIRVMLRNRYGNTAGSLPSERSLQRWFKAQHLYKPKGLITVAVDPEVATAVHDTWQVDAKEKLHLGSAGEQKACYLTVVDQRSGSLLKAVVFPLSAHQ